MKVKVASLVLDYNLYPRHHTDEMCIADYVEAMRSGVVFPPVIADRKSRRVVDGWKRTTAALKLGGDNADIDVEFRDYRNDKDLLLEAVHLNAIHGERLTHYDIRRCIILCEEMKIPATAAAEALNLTMEKFTRISENEIHRDKDGNPVVASKRATRWLIKKGKPISKRQREALQGLVGLRQVAMINQVIILIQGNILDQEDEQIMAAAERLYLLLGGVFAAKAA